MSVNKSSFSARTLNSNRWLIETRAIFLRVADFYCFLFHVAVDDVER